MRLGDMGRVSSSRRGASVYAPRHSRVPRPVVSDLSPEKEAFERGWDRFFEDTPDRPWFRDFRVAASEWSGYSLDVPNGSVHTELEREIYRLPDQARQEIMDACHAGEDASSFADRWCEKWLMPASFGEWLSEIERGYDERGYDELGSRLARRRRSPLRSRRGVMPRSSLRSRELRSRRFR